VKSTILQAIKELSALSPQQRIDQRIEKFGKMGFWEEYQK
jgi:acetyl-CoA carboxylase carboxyl transferase subunit alpha